ncbi:MAG: hypothetical protein J6R86_01740 [Lentisphaeria bacterium]|nr:hypothetical protein [Lentisphaeria bacterium]
MKIFLRTIWFFIFCAAIAAQAAEHSGTLRIGDASGGHTLAFLRHAWLKLSTDKRFRDGEFTYSSLKPEQALKKLASKEVDLIILEKRDIPEKFSGKRKLIAAEALVCYTTFGNPLTRLSLAQLKEIWSAVRPEWKKYNGEFNTIHRIGLAFDRGGFVEGRFLGTPLRTEGIFRCKDIQRAWLFCTPAALICAPFYENTPGLALPVPIDGITPTKQSIISGKYPLSLRYEILFNGKLSPAAEEFLKLIAAPEYAELSRKSGLLLISNAEGGMQK